MRLCYLMGTYLHCSLGTYSLNSSLLGYSISVLTIIGNRLVMIWVLSTKKTTMSQSARYIRVVGLRRFLRCYAVAGSMLRNMMVSHIVILCRRTNDRTTREAIALFRSTFAWWWTLPNVHQIAVWWTSGRHIDTSSTPADLWLVPSEPR